MQIDFQLGRPFGRSQDRRRHVGRRRQLGDGRARRAHRRRGDRRDAPALRSWRGGAAHRRLLRGPGHLRRASRSPTGSASRITCSITKAGSVTGVIDRFVDEYAHGRTPVPCACCNQGVKFVDLVAFARELGADCLATGHYVRRVLNGDRVELHKGADPRRDQSYFLYGTTREQLDFLRFPLGDLPKDEVRRIAAEVGLDVAAKPDSQDICFVPDGDYAGLVKSCGRRQRRRARSSTSTGGCSAAIAAWSISPSDSGAASRSAARRSRCTSCASSRAAPDRRRPAACARGRVDARRGLELDRRGAARSESEGSLACAGGSGDARRRLDALRRGQNMASRQDRRPLLYEGTRLLGGGWIAGNAVGRRERPDAAAA